MQLLVIRHAIAEERDEFARAGTDDSLRPLTPDGIRKMQRGAVGLRRTVESIDVLASSPLVRAMQTAEIVAAAYDGLPIATVDALVPGTPAENALTWLKSVDRHDRVAIVGHEPHLSSLVTWLLTEETESRLDLKKGAACLLDLGRRPKAGEATLLWALTPSQMRMLGE